MDTASPIRRKITLVDIAAGCGVSRATVSLVLRNSPLVNKNTRARVEEELADRMEQLVPGVDRTAMRAFLRELYEAHAETREERLGNVFGTGP